MGRYVFTPAIFESIDRTKPGAGGEIQLTDAIGGLLPELDVYGYTFDEGRYDIGSKLDYLRATVELALAREDLGPEFREWLSGYVREQRHRLIAHRSRVLIPLADAQAHVLERVAPLEPRRGVDGGGGGLRAGGDGDVARGRAAVRQHRDGRLRGAGRRHGRRDAGVAGGAAGGRRGGGRAPGGPGARGRARRCGSSPARRSPTAPTPS